MIQKESLAQNIVRFFTLMIFEAGILAGIGSALLLDQNPNFMRDIVILLILFVLGLCGITIWQNYIPGHGNSAVRSLIRIFTSLVFIAGILIGIATLLLTGINGSIGMMVCLFAILLGWGLWLFRPDGT